MTLPTDTNLFLLCLLCYILFGIALGFAVVKFFDWYQRTYINIKD